MCTNLMLSVPVQPGARTPKANISGRTLELSGDLPARIYLVPRQQSFPLVKPPPPVSHALDWKNEHGFVAAAGSQVLGTFPCFMDGLNEKGLSVAALWLPGTVYPSYESDRQVFFSDLPAWMLGNFERVSEIADALHTINVVGPAAPANGGDPDHYLPLHFIATDATGQSLIVEFPPTAQPEGQMVVYGPDYENGATSNGVLTNAPTYDQQLANLAKYKDLTVIGPATTLTGGGPPVGSGLDGLPGDPTSESRFVRASILRERFSLLPANGQGWLPAPNGGSEAYAGAVRTCVNVALQLVQIVMETPYGMLLQESSQHPPGPPTIGDWTQWTVARDHTHVDYYFTSPFNNIPRVIDLSQIDFASAPGFPNFNSIALNPPDATWPWRYEVQFTDGAVRSHVGIPAHE